MFSIIIPTLWKSPRIHKLLIDLKNSAEVGEIILIDNNNKYKEYYDNIIEKVKIITPSENLYVGPSWNLGVAISNFDYIALCNDDIEFNPEILSKLYEYLDKDYLIGQSAENYNNNYEFENFKLVPFIGDRPVGWGCLILFKKKLWQNIPEFKIWFTDDWLIKYIPAEKYVLTNFTINAEMSTSTISGEFDGIIYKDRITWSKYF